METIDEEFLAAAKDFINRQHRANKPWFCYFNSTRMHVFTHLKKESQGKTGLGIFPDGMVETDGHVGELLKLLDELGALTTPSWSTLRIMAPKGIPGQTAAQRHSRARKRPTGRAASASRA